MKLHYRKVGEGPAVFILHGLLGSSDNWQTFGKQLSTYGFSVYMIDLRNHGHSPHHPFMTYEALAEDVHELFQAEQISEVILMGHSLGGKTAMTFAFRWPDIVKGLIVVDIAPRQYPLHHQHVLDALSGIDLSAHKGRQEVVDLLNAQLNDNGTVQFLAKNLYRKEKDQFAWRFNLDAIEKQIENVGEPTLPATVFTRPTLFIKGSKSEYITYDDEKEIFENFDKVEIKTAPGAGHWVHADNPEWMLENVLVFIKSLN